MAYLMKVFSINCDKPILIRKVKLKAKREVIALIPEQSYSSYFMIYKKKKGKWKLVKDLKYIEQLENNFNKFITLFSIK